MQCNRFVLCLWICDTLFSSSWVKTMRTFRTQLSAHNMYKLCINLTTTKSCLNSIIRLSDELSGQNAGLHLKLKTFVQHYVWTLHLYIKMLGSPFYSCQITLPLQKRQQQQNGPSYLRLNLFKGVQLKSQKDGPKMTMRIILINQTQFQSYGAAKINPTILKTNKWMQTIPHILNFEKKDYSYSRFIFHHNDCDDCLTGDRCYFSDVFFLLQTNFCRQACFFKHFFR